MHRMPIASVLVLFLLGGCQSQTAINSPEAGHPQRRAVSAATSAEKVEPLGVGDVVPSAAVRRVDGFQTDLARVVSDGPAVLIFYRGGWCPYCNRHLEEVAGVEEDLIALGYRVIAISPDKPTKLARTADEHNLDYTLLSDSDANAIRAFGLAFRVDDATFTAYKNSYDIDLEAHSGRDHHLLPVPAVFVVDANGTIRFVHYEANYRERLSGEKILQAARDAAS